MNRLFFRVAVSALLWQSLSLAGHAQLVQVAPGYVKAPFVRVYSYPDGGSYVRAPFVSVFSPGYGPGPVVRGLPTPRELGEMSYGSLSQAIREWTAQLDADLNRFPSGQEWKSRLKTSEIAALMSKAVDAPPAEDVRRQLQAMLDIVHAARNAPDSKWLATLLSFQILDAALGEYVTMPAQRLRRQLFWSAGELNQSLGRFATGAGWRQYLALSPGMALADGKVDEPQSLQSRSELAAVLERFNTVSQNNDYRVISSLPAFMATHQRLANYLPQVQSPSSQPPEELPAPRPVAH